MRNYTKLIWLVTLVFSVTLSKAQVQKDTVRLIIQEKVMAKKIAIRKEEKEALKKEVAAIDTQLRKGEITKTKAQFLKEAAAKKRALNIENRIAIYENRIALLDRNKEDSLSFEYFPMNNGFKIRFGSDIDDMESSEDKTFLGVKWNDHSQPRPPRYDRRTYSDFIIAIGLNNVIADGQSLNDSPYQIGGSRFFEFGWQWRTRVFKNSNFMRINYGVSFQFNGLKPKGNQYFVSQESGETTLETFDVEFRKSKFRMDYLVVPVHLEFGPSTKKTTDAYMRYSLRNQFRFGIGGYGGFNLGSRQKLKYDRNGERVKEKLKRGYNTNNLVYGLSGYVGIDGVSLYAKYDLSTMFKNNTVNERMLSLGVRFDLD